MQIIEKSNPPTNEDVAFFLKQVNFVLPVGFIDFFIGSNGAYITSGESYVHLWALTNMFQLNKEYNVEEYAPDFFIFGSDGGDTAFAIEKVTGYIYEMPFIGMSKDEAILRNKNFSGFISAI